MSKFEIKSAFDIQAACLTHQGLVRTNNEDRFFLEDGKSIFIVSDGMGGQEAGEVASQAVVTVLPNLITQHLNALATLTDETAQLALRNAVIELSVQLRNLTVNDAGLSGLGATLVLVMLHGQQAHLLHVGDSRIYLFRKDRLQQVTHDHSLSALLVEKGEITPEEAKSHPSNTVLLRYIGMDGELEPAIQSINLQKNDRLLLCTDGLTGFVSDKNLGRVLKKYPKPKSACEALVNGAIKAGGRDNITVMVIDCV